MVASRRGQLVRVVMDTCSHVVEFVSTDEQLVKQAATYMYETFAAGSACIAAVTAQHRDQIAHALAERGLDTDALIADYRYIVIDAQATLDTLRPNGRFDVAGFHRNFGQLISLAAAGGKSVRILGEIVTLLAQQGEGDAVIELEELWNDLSRTHPFTLYCLYPAPVFNASLDARHRHAIRALHSHVLETD